MDGQRIRTVQDPIRLLLGIESSEGCKFSCLGQVIILGVRKKSLVEDFSVGSIQTIREIGAASIHDLDNEVVRACGEDITEIGIPWDDREDKASNVRILVGAELFEDRLDCIAPGMSFAKRILVQGLDAAGDECTINHFREKDMTHDGRIVDHAAERRFRVQIEHDNLRVGRYRGDLPNRDAICVDGFVISVKGVDFFWDVTWVDILKSPEKKIFSDPPLIVISVRFPLLSLRVRHNRRKEVQLRADELFEGLSCNDVEILYRYVGPDGISRSSRRHDDI
mmetsp:Transcript_46094/g.112588  ORF Transcript_46094/g.112588 Transcript_46094/m.112588 type:complete len:280 (-) Transcript_46094:1579-2418(-)